MNAAFRNPILALPLIWLPAFSAKEVGAVAATLFFLKCWDTVRDRGWLGSSNIPWMPHEMKGGSTCAPLEALFSIQLYLPLVRWFGPSPPVVFFIGVGLLLLSIFTRPVRERSVRFSTVLTGLIPLSCGAGVWMTLSLSSEPLPTQFIPTDGSLTALGMISVWWALVGELSRSGEGKGLSRPALLAIVVVLMFSIVGRIGLMETKFRALQKSGETKVGEWDRLLHRTHTLDWRWLDRRVRMAALGTSAWTEDPMTWVHWAKETSRDLSSHLEDVDLFWRYLARGGKVVNRESRMAEADAAVGLCLDLERRRLWIPTKEGMLLQVSESLESFSLDAEVGAFVHCRLDPEGRPLLLEAGGRVLRFENGEGLEVVPTLYGESAATFRRLRVNTKSDEIFALDLFGNFYRSRGDGAPWEIDERFVPVSRSEGITFDVARDIALSTQGSISLLTCFGEIWSSSLDSVELVGPRRKSHYWPDYPVGQSLSANEQGYEVVDRFGGFYLAPYPSDPAVLELRRSYLFPRSLPRKAGDIVDHVFLEDRRWLYMLTGSGRVLTNHRWSDFWR